MMRRSPSLWLALLAIAVVIAGTFALLWLVWRSPHRNDLATFGAYAGAIVAIAVGLIGTAVSAITRAKEKGKGSTRDKDYGSGKTTLEFAHIGVIDREGLNWKEEDHRYYDQKGHYNEDGGCPFPEKCDRYFYLPGDSIKDADLFLDVTVLNNSMRVVILSRLGAEILQVFPDAWGHAWFTPVKILPPEDAYVLQTPNIMRELVLRSESRSIPWDRKPIPVNREIWTNLPDPIYLRKGTPYRFILRFEGYQRNMLEHAQIRLLAEAGAKVARSQVLHVFTNH